MLAETSDHDELRHQLRFHPVLRDLGDRFVDVLADHARMVRFQPGEVVFRAGEPADCFFLIVTGTVSVRAAPPGGQPRPIQTLLEGELLGWSWLFPPHHWSFDAVAETLSHAVEVDGAALRRRFDTDHELAYQVLLRIAGAMAKRLHGARRQILDLSRNRW